jgi:hypothetical protein
MTARLLARAAGAVAVLACAAPLAAQGAAAAPTGAAPQPRAQASPRDTAKATVGGAQLLVDYGRPSKRGRQIFGSLVPYNAVWRTGANAATTFVTSAPVRRGSTTIPAGTYTLYTVPAPSGWQLVVNKQTGQWGTEYNQGQDLARIPMKVKTVKAPVEQFTIALAPAKGNAGLLTMTWDTTRAELPFTVAK